jgi:DNA topoisomerase I
MWAFPEMSPKLMTKRAISSQFVLHPRPPGLRRSPTGTAKPRFVYLTSTGTTVTDAATLDRIAALALPPAWEGVWIAPDPDAKVQAVGVDGRGRTQYRYSPAWTAHRAAEKFAHIPDFAAALPRLRRHVASALAPAGSRVPLDRDEVLGVAVRLLDLGFFRVGSERYARDNDTYGLTTLQRQHVRVAGDVLHFDYTAKEHLHRIVDVTDELAAGWIKHLLRRRDDGAELLAWRLPDGGWQPVHSSHVNAYVHTYTGIDATAKQFRTWSGTVLAAAALGGAAHGEKAKTPGLAAVKATSRLLGNTPAVARAAYIHPRVLTAFDEGRTIAAAVSAAAERLGDDRLAVVWRDPGVQDATAALVAR